MDGAANVDHGAARRRFAAAGFCCELCEERYFDRDGGAVGGCQAKADGT